MSERTQPKPFASSADLAEKEETLEVLEVTEMSSWRLRKSDHLVNHSLFKVKTVS